MQPVAALDAVATSSTSQEEEDPVTVALETSKGEVLAILGEVSRCDQSTNLSQYLLRFCFC